MTAHGEIVSMLSRPSSASGTVRRRLVIQWSGTFVWIIAAMSSSSTVPNLLCYALTPSASSSTGTSTILVVGASGGTGPRALQGLLDVGYRPDQIRILTRNIDRPNMVRLRQVGFVTVQADLDDDAEDSTPSLLQSAVRGCTGCYIHSTASDSVRLDTGEVDRARRLLAAILHSHRQAAAAVAEGDNSNNKNNHHVIRSIVYNSAAAEVGHGVNRIAQKHMVDQIFLDGSSQSGNSYFSYTSLRANLFMEELWKSYTRPSIINKGKYPFSIPPDRPIYLTSVRDMGRLAGTILLRQQQQQENRILNVAGDVLTPTEMAAAFGRAQGSKCVHNRGRLLEFIARLFFKDLYQIIRFYQTSSAMTDISTLQTEFPGLLTSFASFLDETRWGDKDRTYDDLSTCLWDDKKEEDP
jgi:uncharacterized protein YbjT (DUF2867 family)